MNINERFDKLWKEKLAEYTYGVCNYSTALGIFEISQPKWLPLEEAPRDGTKFLVKMENGVIYSNCYYDCFCNLQTVIWDGTSRVIFEDNALFMYNP